MSQFQRSELCVNHRFFALFLPPTECSSLSTPLLSLGPCLNTSLYPCDPSHLWLSPGKRGLDPIVRSTRRAVPAIGDPPFPDPKNEFQPRITQISRITKRGAPSAPNRPRVSPSLRFHPCHSSHPWLCLRPGVAIRFSTIRVILCFICAQNLTSPCVSFVPPPLRAPRPSVELHSSV